MAMRDTAQDRLGTPPRRPAPVPALLPSSTAEAMLLQDLAGLGALPGGPQMMMADAMSAMLAAAGVTAGAANAEAADAPSETYGSKSGGGGRPQGSGGGGVSKASIGEKPKLPRPGVPLSGPDCSCCIPLDLPPPLLCTNCANALSHLRPAPPHYPPSPLSHSPGCSVLHRRAVGKEVCPRCKSGDTKFCYYNNYNIRQPRYYCRVRRRAGRGGQGGRSGAAGAGGA